jgi:hypothetical protein
MGAFSKVEALRTPVGVHGEVLQMLQNGEVEQASTLFELAFKRWPANSHLLLLKGDVLAHSSGPQDAASYYAALLKNPDLAVWASGRLLKIVRECRTRLTNAPDLARQICEAEIESKLKEQVLEVLLQQQDADVRL